ncbi:MAG TPA: helix-turn-helix domain-containing protein [Thermoleophilaceae bacterium]
MSQGLHIPDPTLAKAYSHPLRIHILELLDGRIASPRELAAELGAPLSNTSYHVRQLVSFGLVELVARTARRGAIEHHYTSKGSPTLSDSDWGSLPSIIKKTVLRTTVKKAITEMAEAAQAGGFERPDIHYTRTAGNLDPQAWSEVSLTLREALERVERIVEESSERDAPDAEPSTIILMHFGGPKPKDREPRAAGREPVPLNGELGT